MYYKKLISKIYLLKISREYVELFNTKWKIGFAFKIEKYQAFQI